MTTQERQNSKKIEEVLLEIDANSLELTQLRMDIVFISLKGATILLQAEVEDFRKSGEEVSKEDLEQLSILTRNITKGIEELSSTIMHVRKRRR